MTAMFAGRANPRWLRLARLMSVPSFPRLAQKVVKRDSHAQFRSIRYIHVHGGKMGEA